MTRIFYACLSVALLLPATAFAQTVDTASMTGLTTLDKPGSPGATVLWNIDDCVTLANALDERLTVLWGLTIPDGELQYSVKLDTPNDACTESIATEDDCTSIATASTLSESISVNFTAAQLFGSAITGESDCYDSANDGSYHVLLVHQFEDSEGDITERASRLTIDLDLARPESPTGVEAAAGESTIEVSWGDVSAAEGYVVFYSETLGDVLTDPPEQISASSQTVSTGGTTSITLSSGISVDTTYYLTVAAESSSGNLSLVSESVSVTTVPTQDFWELYQRAGGQEAGGCNSHRGSFSWLAFGVLGLLFFRLRRPVAGAALAALLAFPGAAHAELTLVEETPIHGAFELKLGRYNPAIDDEFTNGETPYADRFGDRNPVYLEMEYDAQVWRGFGSLGIFGALGWHQIKGDALNQDGTASDTDTTRVRTLPLRLGLVYRFDELHRRWDVPLAFSVKAGVDYYVWSIRDSDGVASTPIDGEATRGRGATAGYHIALGAHFLLDFLAPRMASSFDLNSGVNNTYLFAELMIASVNDFGSSESWDLSDTNALFGIAFEF